MMFVVEFALFFDRVQLLSNHGGIIISPETMRHLLSRIRDFSEFGQADIISLLLRYQPTSEDDVLEIMVYHFEFLEYSN